MNKLFIFLFLSVLLSLSSCKKRKVLLSTDEKKATELINNDINFTYLSSKAKVNFQDKEQDISTVVNIRMRKDSAIWISITPLLGIEMARLLMTQDSVYMMNRMTRQYFVSDYASFSEAYKANINFGLAQSLLVGDVPIKDAKESKIANGDKDLVLEKQLDDVVITNTISKEIMRLTSVNVLQSSTKNNMHVAYSDFQEFQNNNIAYSSAIKVNADDKESNISIDYQRIKIEEKPITFPFKIPSSYEKM